MKRLLLLVAVMAFALTGCRAVRAVLDTERELHRAGYTDASVGYDASDGVETVTVDWTPDTPTTESMQTDAHDIARIIWQTAPVRFDQVEVVADGDDAGGFDARFSTEELAAEFGPRPARLDNKPEELVNVRGIIAGVLVVGIIGLTLIALIVTLVVRAARKNRRAAPPVPWGQPPPGTWGQQPYAPPPGWSPPPPPSMPPPLASPPPTGPPPADPWQAPPG